MHRAYDPHPGPPKRPVRWGPLVCLAAAVYVALGFYSVQPNERAVVRRCGKALGQLRKPGLHFGFPPGIDRVTRLRLAESKRAPVGTTLSERALGRRLQPQQAECLTGDRNLILVSAIVQYRIAQPADYLFRVADVATLVSNAASSALTSVISSMEVDDVLTVQRIAVQNRAIQATQEMLDRYQAGVQVTSISLEGVAPPEDVAEAFRDVTAAREDKQRRINEAQGYEKQLVPQTRGEAYQIRLEAEGYANEVVQKAGGEGDRFTKLAEQLAGNRPLTVKRLILETMEEVLPRLNKIILDDSGSGPIDLGLIGVEP